MSSVMDSIFHEFDEKSIEYLHFKSNSNLKNSFEGKGDFDILVDPVRISDVEMIIGGHSGKRFNPPVLGRYPGVDNWLVFDENTGILHHIHLHYQLATGKSLVKDYIIPWRNVLFQTRIRDPEYNLYIADPNMELLLLIVRTVVKSNVRKQIKAWLGLFHMNSSMLEEFRDLREKITIDKYSEYAKICGFDKDDRVTLNEVIKQNEIDSTLFRKLSKIVRRRFGLFRRMSGSSAAFLSLFYSVKRRLYVALKNYSESGVMIKKTHDTNGLIIAFVGVDGAGKSTITKDIYSWLGKKVECRRFYMGSGDGKIPVSMKLFNLVKKSGKSKKTNSEKHNTGSRQISLYKNTVKYLKRMYRMHALLAVQRNNNRKIRKMQKYRLNGGISLLDRYPQIEMYGMNDGPKIVGYRDSFVQKHGIDRLIKKEKQALDIVRTIKPDVVFRLNIPAETSMLRKPEQMRIESFQRKIDDLKKITFQNANIIDIDAQQPYEQELAEVKKTLWSLL